MKLRDNQTFMSLYYEPNAVEIATGEADLVASLESWQRETKQLGQVATPEPIARLMANWVMSAKPRAVLDPAAGLGGLLAACRQFNQRVELVGAERDTETLQRAKTSAPPGTKLILADYLKSDSGLFDGIIANPPYVKAHRLDYGEGLALFRGTSRHATGSTHESIRTVPAQDLGRPCAAWACCCNPAG